MSRFRKARVFAFLAIHLALGGWIMSRRGWSSGYRGTVLRTLFFIERYVLFWAIVGALIWLLVPDVLVGSATGLQTALGVLPAVIVAVLVLLLGSVAVIAQMATAAWGTRAPLLLTMDDDLLRGVLRPLTLLIGVLLLAGSAPDPPGNPSDPLAAAVGTMALATAVMTIRACVLPVLVVQAIAPRSFPLFVIRDVERELADGSTGLVVLRGPLLAEMLRMSLQREDSISVTATLEAMVRFQQRYLLALLEDDSVRSHVDPGEGTARDSWLATDLTIGLVNAGERALRDIAPAEDAEATANTLYALARNFIQFEQYGDAMIAIDGLINLGTSAHMLTPQSAYGGVNFFPQPLELLASLENLLESEDDPPEYSGGESVTAYTLAGWALVAAYPEFHFEAGQHPLWRPTIMRLGETPPWDPARRLVHHLVWTSLWGNKQHKGPEPVIEALDAAEADHANRPEPAPQPGV